MSQRFESEELDEATLEYLRTVNRHQGDGVPGMYLDHSAANLASAWLPTAGAILGPILIIATLFCTIGSLDDPINVAMLQTAGVFLGVWMFVAWLRTKIASRRPDYVGHFKLLDPLYLWHATGRGVFVTPLRGLEGAWVDHNHNNEGAYTNSKVTLRLEGERIPVEVKSQYLADRLEAYANLLPEFDRGLPAERGYDALDELNYREDGGTNEDAPAPVRRLVEAIPEPHKVRTVFTFWRYPVVVVLFILTFLCSWTLCKALRDDEIFELVKKDGKPPVLRSYLVDRRNTRHRAEVQQSLARIHDQTAQKIEKKGRDPQLKAGLASLVRAVSHEPLPVLTILVKQSQQAEGRDQTLLFAPQGMNALRSGLIKDLTEYLTPPQDHLALIGAEILAYGEVTSEPAMMVIASHATPVEGGNGYRIDWTVTMQADAEAPKFIWKTRTEPAPGQGNTYAMLMQHYRDFKTQFEKALPR
jgi:hypothetical protein